VVSALTVGDYLLWNWSLNANHAAIALVSGLTLPPLGLATLWLAAVLVARLLARTARRPGARRGRSHKSRPEPGGVRRSAGARAMEESAAQGQAQGQPSASSSSRKLAA
jgi:hypothetical protein